MKRLTILAFWAGFFPSTGLLRAADPPIAPTIPRVPAPTWRDGEVLPAGQVAAPRWDTPQAHNGPGAVTQMLTPNYYQPYDPYGRTTGSKTLSVTPVSGSQAITLPPSAGSTPSQLPPTAGTVPTPAGAVPLPTGYLPAGPGCADGSCSTGTAGHGRTAGSLWHRFVGWLCYRPQPVRLGLHPSPLNAPLYTYFPCNSAAGCAGGPCVSGTGMPGCATPGGCAPGVAERSIRNRLGFPERGVAGGTMPVVDPAIPGYHMATPVNLSVAGTTPLPSMPVESAAYKRPLPRVSPQPAGPTWAPRR